MISQTQEITKKILMNNKVGREILGFVASIYSIFKFRKFCLIFYNKAWIHQHRHGTVVDSIINFQASSDLESSSSESWFHVYKPKFGDIIIDVGAGIGTDTLLFSKMVGPSGKVIAVEAHPKTFISLSQMCKYNKLSNVVLCNCAITDKKMDVFIDDSNTHHISNTILGQSKGFKVDGLTLDDLLNKCNIGHIDFLKMNIEGAEKLAIKGMQKTVKKTRCLAIACHDFISKREGLHTMKTKDTIVSFLRKNGFEVILREKDRRDWVRDHVHGRICEKVLVGK